MAKKETALKAEQAQVPSPSSEDDMQLFLAIFCQLSLTKTVNASAMHTNSRVSSIYYSQQGFSSQ
jgi:hypothetical protein